MAKRKLELLVTAKDQASSTLDKVRGGVTAVAKAAAVAGAAATAMGAAVLKAAEAAAKQQSGINKLDLALNKAGSSYGQVGKAIEAFAAAQQNATRFGDDVTRSVISSLVTITGEYSDQTLRAAAAAQDMAEVMGTDATAAANNVGRALNGNVMMLQRAGIEIKGYTAAQLTAMDAARRHEIVLGALEERFKGGAASISPFEQALANLRNTAGDVVEAFGDAATGAGIAGAINKVTAELKALESWIKGNGQQLGEDLKVAFKPAIAGAVLLAASVKGIVQLLGVMQLAANRLQFAKDNMGADLDESIALSKAMLEREAAITRSIERTEDLFQKFKEISFGITDPRSDSGGAGEGEDGGDEGGVAGTPPKPRARPRATSTTKDAAEKAAEIVGREMAAALKAQFDRTTEVTGLLGGVLDPELAPIAGQRDSDAEEMTRRLAEDHEIRKGIWEVEADVRDDQTRQLESFAQSWGSFGTLFASIAAAVIVGGENMNKQLAMLATQALGQGIGAAASAAGAGPLGPIIGQAAGAVGGAIVEKMFEESSSRRRDMANAGGLGGSRTDAFGTSSPFEQKTSIYNITVRGAVAGTAAELGRSVTEWQREAQRAGMVG